MSDSNNQPSQQVPEDDGVQMESVEQINVEDHEAAVEASAAAVPIQVKQYQPNQQIQDEADADMVDQDDQGASAAAPGVPAPSVAAIPPIGATPAASSACPPMFAETEEEEFGQFSEAQMAYLAKQDEPDGEQDLVFQSNPKQPLSGDVVNPNEDIEEPAQIISGATSGIKIEERVRVSSIPFEEKQKALKAFWDTCWQEIKDGEFIDAIDSVQKWMLGTVAEKDDTIVRVHFDGWSNKWDVNYRWTSSRIAPFRRYSKGYTGQTKIPFRNNMSYSSEWLQAQLSTVERIIDTDFQELSAKEMTQYLRGSLFVNVDFVLSANTYTDEDVAQVIEFVKATIRLVIAWLKKVPSLLPKCLKELKQEAELFLVDEDAAILLSVTEVIGTLQRLFAGCHRCMRFYMHYDTNQTKSENSITKDFLGVDFVARRTPIEDYDIDELRERIYNKADDLVFGSALNFLDYFNDNGGFTAFMNLLKIGNARPTDEEMADKSKAEYELIPLETLGDLTSAFLNCGSLMKEEFAKDFVNQVEQIMTERLMHMRDAEVKELDKDSLQGILKQFKNFLSITKGEDEISELIEKIQMFFASRFLKTTYLEKRLKGVSDIRALIERVDAKSTIERQFEKAHQMGNTNYRKMTFITGQGGIKIRPSQYLDSKLLKQWLIEEEVAETIFGEGAHPEILKRAGPVLIFLAQHNCLTEELVDMVWKSQQGKHEETVRVVYNMIIEIIDHLPIPLLQFLFVKVQDVPESQYSEMYLQFIKDYTLRALQAAEDQQRLLAASQVDENPSDDAEAEDRDKVENDQDMMLRIEKTVFADIQKAMDSPETVACPQGLHLYGLPIFWKIAQDSYKTQSDLSDADILSFAIGSMKEIFEQQSAKNIRMYYLLKVLNNLKSGKSLFTSIQVFMSAIEGIDSYFMNDYTQQNIKLTKQQALEYLEKQIGLVDIMLKDIALYDQNVKNTLKNLVKKDLETPENIENHVFEGKTGHKKALQLFFNFLEFVVIDSNWAVTIREQNIDTLWKLFVLQPNFIQDQTVFLNFLNKPRNRTNNNAKWDVNTFSRGQQVIYLFTDDEQKHLFTQILCNPTFIDFQNMSSALAKCFHTYFKLINIQQGNLEQYRKKLEVVDFSKLVGLDTLWQLSFESRNDKARDESRELLVDVHLRLGNSYDMDSRRGIMSKFVQRAMEVLTDASNNIKNDNSEQKALSVVQALSEFLDRYEGKRPIKPEMKFSSYYSYNLWTIQVVLKKQQSKEARIQISQFESLGAVRQKCANAFNLEINEFHLTIKQTKVDQDEDDDKYVRDYGMSQQIFLYVNQQYDKKGHPKYMLAQNQDYFQLLFALLSKSKNLLLEPVWDLLQRLPVNQKLHEDIKELHEAQQDWNNILDSSSTHKLLYSLKIIEGLKSSIASQQKPDENEQAEEEVEQPKLVKLDSMKDIHQWKSKFVDLGGFNHLLSTFTGLQIQTIDSKLTLRCIESLLSQLQEFCNLEVTLQSNILDQKEAVVLSCLKYIHMIGQFSIQIEKQRGEAFEDIQQKRAQKKQAKLKMKQLQQAGLSKNMRKQASNEDNDSDEEDECAELINAVIHEFAALRAMNEKLFSFMMNYVFIKDESSLRILEQYPDLKDLLLINMLTSENFKIRLETGKKIKEILQMCSGKPELGPTIVAVVKVLLVEILPLATSHERRSFQLFDQTKRIIEDLVVADLKPLEDELWQLIQNHSEDILTNESLDTNTKNEDRILNGKLSIIRVLLQKYPNRKQEIGVKLVPYLVHDCLFEVPHRSGQDLIGGNPSLSKPKCKSTVARKSAFNLLSVLSRDNLDNLKHVLEYIKNFSKQASWRTNKQSDWSITHFDDEKSTTGYAGMKNLGCICYMISLFQQLFMVPSFRDDLLAVEDPNHDNAQPDENMFYQFQALFQGLLRSEKQYVNPKGFCHAFKDWEGQPTNVLEQMDAEEFLNMFMDRLETAIKKTPQEKTIQTHFGGRFANEMICQTCPHQYERSEPFLNIGVHVKNKKSLQESLMAFIQGDMLEGDNAYHCAKCDKKVDTLKRTSIKELPRFLIITLKRFEFDFDRMVRVKVNDYLEFPIDLDMFPYTQEGLSRREQAAKNKQEAAERGEEYTEPTEEEPRKYPAEYYEFKLKGIVVHTGTADSGHYYSFIREQETKNGEKWYEFNDNIVRDFDISELSNECFGGEDSYIGQNMISIKTQKWRNAYLTVYERKNQDIKIKEEEEVADGPSPTKLSKKDSQMQEEQLNIDDKDVIKSKIDDEDHPIQQKIRLENQKYWQNKFLFGNEYFEFVSDITHFWDTANPVPLNILNCNDDSVITGYEQRQPQVAGQQNSEIIKPLDEVYDLRQVNTEQEIADASHEVFKFQAIFYLTILQRNQNKGPVPKAIHAFKSYINNDPRNGLWFIKQLSNWDLIEENLLQTLDAEMPRFVVGLVYSAMLGIYPSEKDQLNCHWPTLGKDAQGQPIPNPNQKPSGVLGNFILMMVQHMYEIKNFTWNMPHYFQIIARFASLGPEAREFLLRAKAVGRCMDFFFENASPYRELYSDMSDLGDLVINENTELGLPTVINKKFNSYFQMLQEKRRKQQLAGATPKYKYLMEVVSLCIRHMKLNSEESTQYQLDKDYPVTVTAFITQQEVDVFIPEAKFLKRFIMESKRNRAIQAVVKAHVHYAYFDTEHVDELFKTVEHGLSDQAYDYDRIRPFMCLLETLLTTNHVNFTSKLDDWLKRFLKVIQANQNFYKWMEVALDYVFKFVGRYEHIRLWFYNNDKQWKFLYDWLSQNQQPPHMSQTNQNGVRLYKNRQNLNMNTMQSFNDQSNSMKNRINTAYRFRKLKEMLHQKVKDLSNEPDTDILDYQDFKFIQGDVATIIDRKSTDSNYKGTQWRVQVVLDEMLNLSLIDESAGRSNYGGGSSRWQKLDTDKIYYGDYYAKLNKNVEKSDIYEIKQQQKIDAQNRQNQRNQGNDEDESGDVQEIIPTRKYQKKKNQGAQGEGGAGGNRDMSSDDYDSNSSDDEAVPETK